MKINTVSKNNFKGIYVDKTKENGGNWKMVYRPYSWEIEHEQSPQDLNILYSSLSDDEFIYTEYDGIGIKKDLLGTEFYRYDAKNDIKRSTITPGERLTREESLKIKSQKIDNFITLKKEYEKSLGDELLKPFYNDSKTFRDAITDLNNKKFSRQNTIKENTDIIEKEHSKVLQQLENKQNKIEKYVQLLRSIDTLKETQKGILEELDVIQKAKQTCKIIDVSALEGQKLHSHFVDKIQELLNNGLNKDSNILVIISDKIIFMKNALKDFDLGQKDVVQKLYRKIMYK